MRLLIKDNNVDTLNTMLTVQGPCYLDCNKFFDIQIFETKYKNITLLHLAVIENKPKIVSLLLKKGANIRAKDEAGKTPLLYVNADKLEKPFHTELELTTPVVDREAIEVIDLLFKFGAT